MLKIISEYFIKSSQIFNFCANTMEDRPNDDGCWVYASIWVYPKYFDCQFNNDINDWLERIKNNKIIR